LKWSFILAAEAAAAPRSRRRRLPYAAAAGCRESGICAGAGAVGNAGGLVLSLWSRTAGLQGVLAWLSVAIYATLLLGALYFLLRPSRRD
jgi:hypothetical protein